MSDVLTIPLTESVAKRLRKLSAGAGEDVEKVVASVIEDTMPKVGDSVPPEIREELESLEDLSNNELRKIALSWLETDESFQPGGSQDRHMLRKAYAGALLKWRDKPVSRKELEAACPNT